MLIKAVEQERDTLRQEGYDRGQQDGIEQGIEQGVTAQRQTLLRLVAWRFSPTAEEQAHYAAQLEQIETLEPLLHLVDQVLTQPTLTAFAEVLQGYLPLADQ